MPTLKSGMDAGQKGVRSASDESSKTFKAFEDATLGRNPEIGA